MKKACLVVSKPYLNNRIFDRSNKVLNRDDCLVGFYYLRREFKRHGVDLSTCDLNTPINSDYILYNDMPRVLPSASLSTKSFLLILESPLVVKDSWNICKLSYFKKVFSWNDKIIDNNKFIKINYSFEIPRLDKDSVKSKRSKFCCLISAHKRSSESNELYSERINAIRWFERHSSGSFDLYGLGWDLPIMKGLLKGFKKVPFLLKLFPFKPFPSYRGKIDSKNEILKEYNFAICYENIEGLNGYITEKIFDCLFAGTIPIYLGASNISDYIPENCFIDKRKYGSYDQLYSYLISLREEDIIALRSNIKKFLESEEIKKFSAQEFSRVIVKNIIESHV